MTHNPRPPADPGRFSSRTSSCAKRWRCGIEKNRKVLETFTRYHHEQGLSPRQLTVGKMFAPETFAAFRI